MEVWILTAPRAQAGRRSLSKCSISTGDKGRIMHAASVGFVDGGVIQAEGCRSTTRTGGSSCSQENSAEGPKGYDRHCRFQEAERP